jgi:delta24(24(1))-sterol reductase
MTVAIISGNVITWVTYFVTIAMKRQHRMSGSFFYDLFMGAPLNPRINTPFGFLDLKMWAGIF